MSQNPPSPHPQNNPSSRKRLRIEDFKFSPDNQAEAYPDVEGAQKLYQEHTDKLLQEQTELVDLPDKLPTTPEEKPNPENFLLAGIDMMQQCPKYPQSEN